MKLGVRSGNVWLLMVATALLAGLMEPQSSTKAAQEPAVAGFSSLYADDPNHLWNRVHRQLLVRVAPGRGEYGADEIDPLLWRETKYLLTEPSHSQTIRLLDEFLEARAERLIGDPVRRAVFQHDLWAVFDWLAGGGGDNQDARVALMTRLARLIRRVALDHDQIERLPDNYAMAVESQMFADGFDPADRGRAFLPRGMFGAGGPWVAISSPRPVAAQHAGELSHSAFFVLWHVSGGADATVAYLRKLWDSPEPYVIEFESDGERRVMPNPALPAVPDGAQIALVRKMLLIDRRGRVAPSPLTEVIQLRVLSGVDPHFFEFRMRRRKLFAGEAAGLDAVRPGERAYSTFSSKGNDPLDANGTSPRGGPPEILAMCPLCHQAGPTSRSVLSLRRLLKPESLLDSKRPRWDRWFNQANVAAERKAQRADWGLLRGLWYSNPW